MPWWGWLLTSSGVVAMISAAWIGIIFYLMSKGDG